MKRWALGALLVVTFSALEALGQSTDAKAAADPPQAQREAKSDAQSRESRKERRVHRHALNHRHIRKH